MKTLIALMLFAVCVSAEDKPSDPVSDRLRFEIAIAQRDYLAVKAQLDQISQHIAEKTKEANAACASANKQWNAEVFACADTPKSEGRSK